MRHHRVVGITTAVAGEAQPKTEIDVLEIAEERLVEGPHLRERRAFVERGRRARREDLAAAAVGTADRGAVVGAPGEARGVVGVAGAVEHAGIGRVDHAAAEEAEFGVGVDRRHQRLEPLRSGKGVGVEQRRPRLVRRHLEADVVGGRKAAIRVEPAQAQAAIAPAGGFERAVLAGVVDEHDRTGALRLRRQRRETSRQIGARVPVDHDDRHVIGRDRGLTRPCPPTGRHGELDPGDSSTPARPGCALSPWRRISLMT